MKNSSSFAIRVFRAVTTAALVIALPLSTEAASRKKQIPETAPKNVVTHNGITYNIGDNTILLDREGIFNCKDAFTDPVKAFEAVNSLKKGKATVLVAPSVYWLDNPDDPADRLPVAPEKAPYAMVLNCDTLEIIGLSDKAEDVVLAVNRGQTQGAVGNFTMFHFFGKSLVTKNMTFGNYCNMDLVYPRNPEFNRAKRKSAIVQAQIGICSGTDRLYADNCQFLSRLNLCPFIGAGRSLYKNCYFECTDDALSGSGVYLDCAFTFFSSKPFYGTAETGAVFLNCDIHSLCNGTQYFTKVPGMVTVIDIRITSDHPVTVNWTRDESDIRCFQHNVTLNGEPYIIDTNRPQLSAKLAGTDLMNAYSVAVDRKNIYNIPNLLGGDDGWDPLNIREEIERAERTLGVDLLNVPVAVRIERNRKELNARGDTTTLRAVPLLWGSYIAPEERYPRKVSWDISSPLTGNGDGTKTIVVTSRNNDPESKSGRVGIRLASGLTGASSLSVKPYYTDAPIFTRLPKISSDKKTGSLTVDYAFNKEGDDASLITWYRIIDGDSVAVCHGIGKEARTYNATHADRGQDMAVTVHPRLSNSYAGTPASTQIVANKIYVPEGQESHLSTTFAEIPVRQRKPGVQGLWSFDTYKPIDTLHVDWDAEECNGWYYGPGDDGAKGPGLVQWTKGARLSYIPARNECGDMELTLTTEPAKPAGQGFGSATKQYMDVCIKFDPVNLDGYALRIERTPDHDRAVTFSLVRYDKGVVSVISDAAVSSCYRTPCNITLKTEGNRLLATASTDAAKPDKVCCDEVRENVQLEAQIEPSPLHGFCIQHTGSTGASATLLRNLTLSWHD